VELNGACLLLHPTAATAAAAATAYAVTTVLS